MEYPKTINKNENSRLTQNESEGIDVRRTAIAIEDPQGKSKEDCVNSHAI